ncbi:MAG: M24 family metallopeptidase [Vampirovibrionales bacterium]
MIDTVNTPHTAHPLSDAQRCEALCQAQHHAERLFERVLELNLVRAGQSERTISDAILELATQEFGTRRFWHKRIVRSGPNTLHPYKENPPDRTLLEDDIVFLDFGPVFEQWEADLGIALVLGQDARKHQLVADTHAAWKQASAYYQAHPTLTGAELYAYCQQLATHYGWVYGGPYAGHLVGEFPHEKILGDDIPNYIHPNNHAPMNTPDANGQQRFWILEMHFVDTTQQIGAFIEKGLNFGVFTPAMRGVESVS